MFALKNGYVMYQLAERGDRFLNWKTTYNFAFNAVVLAMALAFYRRRPLITVMVLAFSAAVNIVLGSRSPGLCMAIGAGLSGIQHLRLRGGQSVRQARVGLALIFLVATIGAGVAAKTFYQEAIAAGWMGDVEKWKYENESRGKYGMILTSRGSVLECILAIYDKPLFGHGAWAMDTGGRNYSERADEILGRKRVGSTASGGRISFHSQIFGDWMQWGMAFGIFWAMLLWLAVKALLFDIQRAGQYTAFLGVLVPMVIWDIFFSPVGDRVATAANAAIVVALPFYLKTTLAARLIQARERPSKLLDGGRVPPARLICQP